MAHLGRAISFEDQQMRNTLVALYIIPNREKNTPSRLPKLNECMVGFAFVFSLGRHLRRMRRSRMTRTGRPDHPLGGKRAGRQTPDGYVLRGAILRIHCCPIFGIGCAEVSTCFIFLGWWGAFSCIEYMGFEFRRAL